MKFVGFAFSRSRCFLINIQWVQRKPGVIIVLIGAQKVEIGTLGKSNNNVLRARAMMGRHLRFARLPEAPLLNYFP